MVQKSSALIFDTNFCGTIKEGEVRDGKFLIKEKDQYKEWILSIPQMYKNEKGEEKIKWHDVRPFKIKGRFGNTKDMYLLKWNSLYPLAFQLKNEKKVFVSPDTGEQMTIAQESLEQVMPDFKDTKILPELLGETHDLRFLKGMKKYTGETDSPMKGIMIAVAVVVVLAIVGYVVYYSFFQKK